MAEKLSSELKTQAEIFSTGDNEFVVVFSKEVLKARTSITAQNILYSLSEPIQINDTQVQSAVTGCLCWCDPKVYSSAESIFVAIDRSIAQAKDQKGSVLTQVT